MIWNNARAVIGGLFQTHSEFQRTPKFVQAWADSAYALRVDSGVLVEIGLTLYALWGAWVAWRTVPALVPYLLIHAASFATVIMWDTCDQWRMTHTPMLHPGPIPESGND
jgi:hypothetical protein